jgi:tRNA-uridine 2-sulfurtransferase
MRVVAAMSGGVDSAVAAALMQQAGHEVIGVTMWLADRSLPGGDASPEGPRTDVEAAREVAALLGIPHHLLDLRAAFFAQVLAPFVESYLAGETPLPCARCNARLKLGELLGVADRFGAEMLVTGHYARLETDAAGNPTLWRAGDRERDQSYFLFGLTQRQLRRAVFPLGGMRKSEVRVIARRLGLPNAGRRDSQEVCFVSEGGSYLEVLERFAADRLPGAGEIVDQRGGVVGHHRGFHRFTVGQRRGIGVPGRARLYVVAVDSARNRVVVGTAPAARSCLRLREVNWLDGAPPVRTAALVQIRSRHTAAPAEIVPAGNGTAEVTFASPVASPAPGQAAVFYDGDRVLGGGWIVDVE